MAEAIGASAAAGRTELQAGIHQQPFDQRVIERPCRLAVLGGEDGIIGAGCLRQLTDAFEVIGDVAGGDKTAVLAFAAHSQHDKFPVLVVGADVHVAPTQILGFGRSHACVGHDEHEIVGDGAAPSVGVGAGLLDPATGEGMQLPVFLRGEFFTRHLGNGQLGFKDVAFRDVFLAGGKSHDGAEGTHLGTDRRFADFAARPSLACLLPPNRITLPTILANQVDLDGADVRIELGADVGIHHAPAVMGDFPGFRAFLLEC